MGNILADLALGLLIGGANANTGGVPHEGPRVNTGEKAMEFFEKRDAAAQAAAAGNFERQQSAKRMSMEEAKNAADVNNMAANTARTLQLTAQEKEDHPLTMALKQAELDDHHTANMRNVAMLNKDNLEIYQNLIANGVNPTDIYTSYEDASHAGAHTRIVNGQELPVYNGTGAKTDDHGVGMFDVAQLKSRMLTKDTTYHTYTADKDGNPVEETHTLRAGTPVWEYLQQAFEGQATLHRITERQQTKSAVELKKSETTKNYAEAKKFEAEGANASKPLIAYNTETKSLQQTTRQEMSSRPGVFTNERVATGAELDKLAEKTAQLNDAQANIAGYRAASNAYDELTGTDRALVSQMIKTDKFKAEFMGFSLPVDFVNKLTDAAEMKHMSPAARKAVVAYISARGAVISYMKAASGSARSGGKEQLELELQNIPTPIMDKATRDAFINRFQRNIDLVGGDLPKLVGIKSLKETKEEIEKQSPQQNAPQSNEPQSNTPTQNAPEPSGLRGVVNHIFHVHPDGSGGKLAPPGSKPIVKAGKVIGYIDKNGNPVVY
jgi:hypothetical protein